MPFFNIVLDGAEYQVFSVSNQHLLRFRSHIDTFCLEKIVNFTEMFATRVRSNFMTANAGPYRIIELPQNTTDAT